MSDQVISRIDHLSAAFARLADRTSWVRAGFTLKADKFGMFGLGPADENGPDPALLRSLGNKQTLESAIMTELYALTDQAGHLIFEVYQSGCFQGNGGRRIQHDFKRPWQTWLFFLMNCPPMLLHCWTKGPDGKADHVLFTQVGEEEIGVWIDSYPQVCVSALACLKASLSLTSNDDRQQEQTAGSRTPAANPYVNLLLEFQEAYAIHGRDYLWLEAVTKEEIHSSLLPENYVGFIQLPGSHWNILGHICNASQFGARDVYYKLRAAILSTFCDLASRAGAALPLSIRMSIPGYPDNTPVDPLNWWLRILWHLFPPIEEDINPKEGETRVAFDDPFQVSIDAIDICKLNTDQPLLVSTENLPETVGTKDREASTSRTEKVSIPSKNNCTVQDDGVAGGRWLWWKGERYSVPRGTIYRLVEYMWERDSASYDDLEDHVFDSAVAPQTIRSYVNKTNNALPLGFPWRLSSDSTSRHLTKVLRTSITTSENPSIIPN
jgi:hypothetical protein